MIVHFLAFPELLMGTSEKQLLFTKVKQIIGHILLDLTTRFVLQSGYGEICQNYATTLS
jgi:hypothetical protein